MSNIPEQQPDNAAAVAAMQLEELRAAYLALIQRCQALDAVKRCRAATGCLLPQAKRARTEVKEKPPRWPVADAPNRMEK